MIILRFFDQALEDQSIAAYYLDNKIYYISDTAELASLIKYPFIVLLPATWLALHQITVPSSNLQMVKKAIPALVEEHLAEDIDNFHFAIGHTEDKSQYPVLSITYERLDTILQALTDFNIQNITSELLALPYTPHHWSILIETDWVVVRTEKFKGFAIEKPLWSEWINLALQEGLPEKLDIYNCTTEEIDLPITGTTQEIYPCDKGSLSLLAENWSTQYSINLLQGSYQPQRKWQKSLKVWRSAAIIFILYLISITIIKGVELQGLLQQNEYLVVEQEALLKQAVPETKRIINPKSQIKNKLDSLIKQQGGGGSNFLFLLQKIGQHLNQNFELRSFSYRNQALDLEIVANDLQLLENFKQQLSKEGYEAEIISAISQQNQVRARVRLQEKIS